MNTKKMILSIAMLALLGLSACSATTPTANQSDIVRADGLFRTINVTGVGEVNIPPDVAYISIGVHSQSESVEQALADNTDQAQAIASVLEEKGVAKNDIQTAAFNVYPMQDYSPTGEVLGTSYAVDNTVSVTVRDLNSLGSLLDAAVRAGANNIYNITFDVSDKTAALSEARLLAIQNARALAGELADAAEVELGDLVNLYVYDVGVPIAQYEKGMLGNGAVGGSVPVAAGQITIRVEASLAYEIK
jgi:uncharacterized protein